ncbi:hypothetical protein DSC_11905 [Pseudoxanthomonas spadix BD-a59]|uniref:J domain-containing protein n=1 Tax=Pseudoxanthomonas spadix (strain BD-a59) TaxID=1045855 RepID=G7UQV3_PSEUP|nr:hypothetical protein DSC_11905 [Pseudoxanthomonas spadix BD-a59]
MSAKDYYDILGVRPNAGREEIELAYKGRRSQYHPDRYQQSDAETQAWTTSKMQEVNEAYAVLTDEAERTRLDHGRNGSTTRPASPPPQPPPPQAPSQASVVSLKQFLQGCKPTSAPFEKIFVAPDIPMKKVSGAIESYGDGLHWKEIVALIDDTVFGGAKEGFLITETELRFKALFMSPDIYKIEHIHDISSEGNRVCINGREIAKLNIPESKEVRAFFALFDKYLKQCGAAAPAQANRNEQQDPGASAGGRLFAGLRHGFYAQVDETIQRDLREAQSREAWVPLAVISGLLPVSKALAERTRSNGGGLSSPQRAFLSSDMLRLELLTYGMALTGHLLETEAGLEEEQVTEIVMPAALGMLFSYIIEIEGIGEQKKTLRSMANPMAALQESHFFMEFRRRWFRYGLLLRGASGDLAKEFHDSLKDPAAFIPQSAEARVQLQYFAEEAIDRALPAHAAAAFLEEIGEDIEAALVSMFEQA